MGRPATAPPWFGGGKGTDPWPDFGPVSGGRLGQRLGGESGGQRSKPSGTEDVASSLSLSPVFPQSLTHSLFRDVLCPCSFGLSSVVVDDDSSVVQI